MEAHLCEVCQNMFIGEQPARDRANGLYRGRPHHQSKTDLLAAADDDCRICRFITTSSKFIDFQFGEDFGAKWDLYPVMEFIDVPPHFGLRIYASGKTTRLADTRNAGSLPQPDQEVNSSGDVKIPMSGREITAAVETRVSPQWEFILIPTTGYTPASKQHYEPLFRIQDREMWSSARSWLETCQKRHTLCSASRNPNFCPTRLVEILDSKTVRVIDTGSIQPSGLYAAFSHCWGQAKTLKLLKGNKRRLEASIQISELPQSYKEGLDVAIRLSIKYLWIDSLCIIQDSVEDWRAEAATMKDVYSNAVLTIAASSAAENSDSSFQRRDPLAIRLFQVTPGWNTKPAVSYLVSYKDGYLDEVENSPLRRRAWVLQEAYLSPRTLNLGSSQLWWECLEELCCETWPYGVPRQVPKFIHRRYRPGKVKAELQVAVYQGVWDELVERYMSCKLTVLSDKMIAMAGVASHFQAVLGEDEYIAGSWRSRLPQCICWETTQNRLYPKRYRPSQYRAPSWSWASLEGEIAFNHNLRNEKGEEARLVCQYVNAYLVKTGPSPTGDLKGGHLQLRGHLFLVKVRKGYLTVPDRDGIFRYLSGTIEETDSDADEVGETTWVTWDECTSDNQPVVSHLESSGISELKGASFDTLTRATKVLEQWEGNLFCLPVIERTYLEEPSIIGLMLGHAKGEPPNRFQRVGCFHCDGLGACDYFRQGKVQDVWLI